MGGPRWFLVLVPGLHQYVHVDYSIIRCILGFSIGMLVERALAFAVPVVAIVIDRGYEQAANHEVCGTRDADFADRFHFVNPGRRPLMCLGRSCLVLLVTAFFV